MILDSVAWCDGRRGATGRSCWRWSATLCPRSAWSATGASLLQKIPVCTLVVRVQAIVLAGSLGFVSGLSRIGLDATRLDSHRKERDASLWYRCSASLANVWRTCAGACGQDMCIKCCAEVAEGDATRPVRDAVRQCL